MKYLVVFILLISSFSVFAQNGLDENPGIGRIKVGVSFSSVKSFFSSTTLTDELTGEPYYKMSGVKDPKYDRVFGGDIKEIRVMVEEDIITQVYIIFASNVKLSTIVQGISAQYGPAPCGIAVEDEESGGCTWEGKKYVLNIQNVDTPYLYAAFTASYAGE